MGSLLHLLVECIGDTALGRGRRAVCASWNRHEISSRVGTTVTGGVESERVAKRTLNRFLKGWPMANGRAGFWRGVLWVILLEILAGIGFYLFVSLGGLPMTADAQPGALETWAAHVSMHGWLSHHVPHVPDTVAVNDQSLMRGAALYQANCAVCHGGANYAPSELKNGVYPG